MNMFNGCGVAKAALFLWRVEQGQTTLQKLFELYSIVLNIYNVHVV